MHSFSVDGCGNDKISGLAEEPLNPGKVNPHPTLRPLGPHLSVDRMHRFSHAKWRISLGFSLNMSIALKDTQCQPTSRTY